MAAKPNYISTVETFMDRFLPEAGTRCSLFDCTAGKIYVILAVLSVMSSIGSWRNLVMTLVWEVVIGFLVAWMCRSCRHKLAWLAVIVASGAPLLILAALVMGALLAFIENKTPNIVIHH